jgi:transposase-like protein
MVLRTGTYQMPKRKFSHEKRTALVNAFKESTINMKKFTSLHGVGYSTFQRWLSEDKPLTFSPGGQHQPSASLSFMDITPAALKEHPRHEIVGKASSPPFNQLDVTLPNGIRLMLNTSFEQSLILIQSLGSIHVTRTN